MVKVLYTTLKTAIKYLLNNHVQNFNWVQLYSIIIYIEQTWDVVVYINAEYYWLLKINSKRKRNIFNS